MVHRAYAGLGPREQAVREFDALTPHVLTIRTLQARCAPRQADDLAPAIIVDGLETAAFHFTGRPQYFEGVKVDRRHGQNDFEGLGSRQDAGRRLYELWPCMRALLRLQGRCRPFGRDYLALEIAKKGMETAAYHFTKTEGFYGSGSDSIGRVRPREAWED